MHLGMKCFPVEFSFLQLPIYVDSVGWHISLPHNAVEHLLITSVFSVLRKGYPYKNSKFNDQEKQ